MLRVAYQLRRGSSEISQAERNAEVVEYPGRQRCKIHVWRLSAMVTRSCEPIDMMILVRLNSTLYLGISQIDVPIVQLELLVHYM